MEDVLKYLRDRNIQLRESADWCKVNGYKDGEGNYLYQSKQFERAIKILENQHETA